LMGGRPLQGPIDAARRPVEACEDGLVSARDRIEKARAVQREAEEELKQIDREAATRQL